MKFQYNDGGRVEAGFKGKTGDCVVRAIAIATQLSYLKVYDDLNELSKTKKFRKLNSSSRLGVDKKVLKHYLIELGWTWVPTMFIGQGCKVHLKGEELPNGHIIVSLSRHYVAIIDGVIHDTYDCSRDETRCVYGYWYKQVDID